MSPRTQTRGSLPVHGDPVAFRHRARLLSATALVLGTGGLAVVLAGFTRAPLAFLVLAAMAWAMAYAVFDAVRAHLEVTVGERR